MLVVSFEMKLLLCVKFFIEIIFKLFFIESYLSDLIILLSHLILPADLISMLILEKIFFINFHQRAI